MSRMRPYVGAIVQYVGVQEPHNAGMEGRVVSAEDHGSHGATYIVVWAGRSEPNPYAYSDRDLRVLRKFSNSFARRYNVRMGLVGDGKYGWG